MRQEDDGHARCVMVSDDTQRFHHRGIQIFFLVRLVWGRRTQQPQEDPHLWQLVFYHRQPFQNVVVWVSVLVRVVTKLLTTESFGTRCSGDGGQ